MSDPQDDQEYFSDYQIPSGDPKIPLWLKFTYIVLPIWGVIWFFLYWNGATGWIDRGYWIELEKAANTTYPQKQGPEFPED